MLATTCPGQDACPAPGLESFPVTALQTGYWECDVGPNLKQSHWVPFRWPICTILEQAFCRGKPAAEFNDRKMSYKVEFSSAAALRSQEAGRQQPSTAIQVNTSTGMRRQVRRWPCFAGKQEVEKVEAQHMAQQWTAWTRAEWTWLLEESGATAPSLPSQFTPPHVKYSLGNCNFQADFWPDLLRSWPTENLVCAAHPRGEKCNFALRRLMPHCTSSSSPEWSTLEALWQQGGLSSKGAKLVAAFRVQNRGLVHGFAALRQAMLARLAAKEDYADGQSREQLLQVKLLWHGTRSVSGLLDICRDGFDRAHAQVCVYGKGCYFAASAAYSDRYACAVRLPGRPSSLPPVRAVLLAAVLVGEMVEGSSNMYPPPPKPHSLTGDRYENACDKSAGPSIFVTFKDHQALPAYVVLYEP